ncbi:DUF6686 family protein [Aureispira anguillae]|uniref:Uncharacterized protein n=1 Tax=Aureispira anguillae TaxID=2864201 RepID=A0A915VJY0_9BACT|nr:DUF6686 family protein [Aureispira anguillae]BDS09412.1 hypothetical protein AsAng_0001100 [Aureispira anguillae]
MCQHDSLAKNSDGFVLWCNECRVYNLYFKNIVMTLDERGLYQFKENIATCYAENLNSSKDRNRRTILFDTQVNGMRFCFSTNDVGSLLSLMQEAELSYYELKYILG